MILFWKIHSINPPEVYGSRLGPIELRQSPSRYFIFCMRGVFQTREDRLLSRGNRRVCVEDPA